MANASAPFSQGLTYEGIDRTSEELGWRRGYKYDSTEMHRNELVVPMVAKLPPSVDWRDKHAVTSVKQQGQGSTCWFVDEVKTNIRARNVFHATLHKISADCFCNHVFMF